MNYLILGSSGFIGKNLLKKLDKSKHNIRLFDRTNLNQKNYENQNATNLQFVEGVFSPEYDFFELTKDIDVVYHLISTTIPSSSITLEEELTENVFSTIKLLEACKINKVKKIIFLSSGGTVYGKSNGFPFKETDETNPINSYGIQKLTIEKYIQLYFHLYQLDYRIIRLANPYGPGQNPHQNQGIITKFAYNIVNNIPVKIFGQGDVIRDYIYIDDAIDGIIAIEQDQSGEKLFNLGVGQGHTIKEIVSTIENVSNKKFSIHYEEERKIDVPYSVLDISRYLQIAPSNDFMSLEKGVSQLLTYFSKGAD